MLHRSSPPCVTKEVAKCGFNVGEAMDLTTGWGFSIEEDRVAAENYTVEKKPLLLVGSPLCTMFSKL